MNLAAVDWLFLIWYFILSIGIGVYYSGKAGKSISEYFVSGRSLPWWLLGTSMVATTFSSDTPLAVAGIVIKDGISGNWFWWTFLFGGCLTVFFFAHLWRRAAVLTEVEFIDIRYSGASAKFLRGFKALYLGIPVSCITFGWVTLAMVKIIQIVFRTSGLEALAICILITIFYTTLSGLWGVVATDILLFAIAMTGAILLSVASIEKVGGIKALLAAIHSISQQTGKNYISVFPSFGQALPLAFFVALFVQWWAVYYPGAEPGGGGWVAQRMLAARNPKHAVSGTLWFTIAHYVIRPWPWIITALCAMAVFPELSAGNAANVEAAYPRMLAVLPKGIMGLMIASLFAAYMSTIESILNLAGSYLLNDFYKPFLNKAAAEKHYVLVSRLLVVFVAVLGTGFSFILGSVKMGWALIMELSGGIGLVLLLRWYWWRINAWSEISAITASGLMAVYLKIFPDSILIRSLSKMLQNLGFSVDPWALNILLIVAFTTLVWIVMTFLTPPDSREKLLSFYKKVKPGGFWAPIAALNGESFKLEAHPFLGWICGVLVILFFLLGIGEILFLRWAAGLLDFAGGTISAIVLSRIIHKIDWEVQ